MNNVYITVKYTGSPISNVFIYNFLKFQCILVPKLHKTSLYPPAFKFAINIISLEGLKMTETNEFIASLF